MIDKYGFFQTTTRDTGEIIAQMADKEKMGESGFIDTKKALDSERTARIAKGGSGQASGAFNTASSGTLMRAGVLTMTESELLTLITKIEVSKKPMPESVAAIERAIVCIDARRKSVPAPKMGEETHKQYLKIVEEIAKMQPARASEAQSAKMATG